MGIELIHADGRFTELRQITEFTQFDAIVSMDAESDKNDWMLELPEEEWQREPVKVGHYVYITGTEWGGPVERVRHSSGDSAVRIYGTCWRGLLMRRAICPPAGQTHVVFSNEDASDVIGGLLGGWMPSLFLAEAGQSGISCTGSVRYRNMLEALYSILSDADAGLTVCFSEGRVRLRAERSRDLSETVEFSQEYESGIISETTASQFNHIIALGQGEMLDRTVAELWLLPDGTVTDDRTAQGIPSPEGWSSLIYDYTSVESLSELKSGAKKRLLSYAGGDSMEITVNGYESELALTDTVSARDKITGISTALKVWEKNINISDSGAAVKHTLK